MLTAQGLRVVETGFVSDLDSARVQIREMAALLGHPERGERLIADLESARARLSAAAGRTERTGLVVERGGYTQGPASLAATLLAEAGIKSPAGAPAGYGGFIPLEKLLVLRPDLVFLKDPPNAATDQGALFLLHPALRDLFPPQRRVALPTRYTMCGGPALVAAFDYMADEIVRLTPPELRPSRE
jgi:iron complex transport system substrate-binding protein